MRHAASFAVLALFLAVNGQPGCAWAFDEESSRVLSLVSLEYKLGREKVPRSRDPQSYLRAIGSGDRPVVEVAALSMFWERYALEYAALSRERMASVDDLIGGMGLLTPGGRGPNPEIERQRKDFDARLKGPLQQAIRQGALAAFEKKDVLSVPSRGFEEEIRGGLAHALDVQANYYAVQRDLAKMQEVLWDRAEQLAKDRAKSGSLGSSDVAVILRVEPPRLTIALQNKSSRDLHHVTLGATGVEHPRKPTNPRADLALGAGAAALGGEENARKIARSGLNQASAVQDYEAVMGRPTRIFLHLADLPAGKEVSTSFRFLPADAEKGKLGKFSLWTDEGSVEQSEIGGIPELLELFKKNRAKNQVAVRLLQGAHRTAKSDPILAAASFRKVIAQFPKTEEADEAHAWLVAYPRLLIDRAETFAESNPAYAFKFYDEARESQLNPEAAALAQTKLEAVARRLMDMTPKLEQDGKVREARAIYQQIINELPESQMATEARARLKKPTPKR
jgi:hypothetical protein